MVGANQNLHGPRDLITPLSGMIYHPFRGLAFATANLSTKFEVSISTHYEDIKGDAKCGKWGGLRVVKVTQGH